VRTELAVCGGLGLLNGPKMMKMGRGWGASALRQLPATHQLRVHNAWWARRTQTLLHRVSELRTSCQGWLCAGTPCWKALITFLLPLPLLGSCDHLLGTCHCLQHVPASCVDAIVTRSSSGPHLDHQVRRYADAEEKRQVTCSFNRRIAVRYVKAHQQDDIASLRCFQLP
jgi:hypothetical protein